MGTYVYPNEETESIKYYGVYPVDFLIESVLEDGLDWFRSNPEAPNLVFGHLVNPLLSAKYGQSKIAEISEYIRSKKIRIFQSFPLDGEQSPCVSINLSSSTENIATAGLNDYYEDDDVLGSDDSIVSRTEVGYTSLSDNVLIGIHAVGGSDIVKYLYMLFLYILNSQREVFEEEGLLNLTYSATDMSRLNEYLPSNMYSRFITVNVLNFARFKKRTMPIIESIELTAEYE